MNTVTFNQRVLRRIAGVWEKYKDDQSRLRAFYALKKYVIDFHPDGGNAEIMVDVRNAIDDIEIKDTLRNMGYSV